MSRFSLHYADIVLIKAAEVGISTKSGKRQRPSIQTNELREVGRRLGTLAVAWYKQSGQFRVRQREQLRRALQDAAAALDWDIVSTIEDDPMEEMAFDVRRLTKAGIQAIERDLETELDEKRKEIKHIQKTVSNLEKLSEKDPETFPTELMYRYTSARGNGEYSTKEEELLIETPDGASEAAARLEKRVDRFTRLRDEMVESLKQQRKTLTSAKAELVDFVTGTRQLVTEVVATLV